ncbi:MAG: KilA-N domain-containing protein, partial [Chitinophagales bacterium]
MAKLQVFRYKGQEITFDFRNGNRMINATQMAKLFGKETTHFLKNQQTKDYISVLVETENSQFEKIVNIIRGGKYNGTWMHEQLALKFAAWLSPEFEVWVFSKIQELLLEGYISIDSSLPKKITYIYFIKSVHHNLVKIGMTDNIHNRMNSLKSGSPDELILLKIIRANATYPDDHTIHALFPHLRRHGEWFVITPELQFFMEQLEDNTSEQEGTVLYYEERIAELQQEITELKQRLFKNKKLIHQLQRELGKLQQQYNLLKKKQAPTIYLPPNSTETNKTTIEVSSYTDIPPTQYSKILFMAKGEKWEGVKVKDIIYLQGQKRFTRIICKGQRGYEVPQTMNQLLEQLPPKAFIQIHRSYIINLKYLTNVTPK